MLKYMSIDPFEPGSGSRQEIRPLRHQTRAGEPYARDPKIEAKLREALALPRPTLVDRCAIHERKDPDYIPSECLLHLVRTWNPEDRHFGGLYTAFTERLVRRLPEGQIRDELLERFVDMLALDRNTYCKRLDFFEIRFDAALLRMRFDAQRRACREPKLLPIEIDPETGELSPEAEKAIEHFNPFDPVALQRADYRSRLSGAIGSLPVEQRRIMELMLQDVPIDSTIPGTMTIAKKLGKSEKTIRTYRNQAFSALRSILENEKML
jgi:hypothetical protein